MTWKNITLGKFQQIEAINSKSLSDVDKALYGLCVVYDKTEYQIDNEKPEKVLKMMTKMQGVFEMPFTPKPVKAIGRYVINYDISRITFGQYVEISFFIARGLIGNAHYILATMSNRRRQRHATGDHRAKADYFLGQPVEQVLGAANLIQDNYNRFNSGYTQLFGLDPEVAKDAQNDEFNKRYGWIYSATQVAEHERITLDSAFALPLKQAFNDLLFLKAKGKYEMEQLRKSKPVL